MAKFASPFGAKKNSIDRGYKMFISPDDKALLYSGRIDFDNPKAPVIIYAASYVKTIFTGTKISVTLRNKRNCYIDSMGVMLDGVQSKIVLKDDAKNISMYLLKI